MRPLYRNDRNARGCRFLVRRSSVDVLRRPERLANVTRLNQVAANPSQVRYGSITTEGGTGWSNDLDTSPFVEDAETRYTMAAWLIGQYKSSATSITTDGSANGDRNRAIQSAIWSILYNGAADPHESYAEDGQTASFGSGKPRPMRHRR